MSLVEYTIKLYDLNGDPILTVPFDGTAATEEIKNAKNRILTFNLNNYDEFDFDLLLTDPVAYNIKRLKTTIAVWRTVDDPIAGKTLDDEDPIFTGVVGYTNKQGSSNTMTVKCYSALWRLQFHFHLLNHYLDINPDTSDPYSISELMWKLIDLINEAFGVSSFTGIDLGTFSWGYPDGEPTISPFFVPKSSNTWSNIFDTIMTTSTTGVDIIPEYKHTDGDPLLMLFSTDEVRGSDLTASTKFNYHTDIGGDPLYLPNCDDMSEEEAPQPSTGAQDAGFANFVWVVGQGGVNSGKVAEAQNSSAADGSNGSNEVGIYMAKIDQPSLKTFAQVAQQAPTELAIRTIPKTNYSVNLAPGGRLYYGIDYSLGDLVALNADKGALQLEDIAQRVYQVTLNMSDNNIERSQVSTSNDFTYRILSEADTAPSMEISGITEEDESLTATINA